MNNNTLTTGEGTGKKDRKLDDKYYDYQELVQEWLLQYGVKLYYATLATVDFKGILFQSWHDKESPDSVALRLMVMAKKMYSGKVMVSDGPCVFAGAE